jgi:hypothetical protein
MVKTEDVRRGDVFLVSLDPARGGEIQKTRPCVVARRTNLTLIYVLLSWPPLQLGGIPIHSVYRVGLKAVRAT